ncbi:MAG: hypothetical protein HW416_2570 [Chloroflexi bacterium]|nr:hypothetical protein [Chloroflexota bacterium]
MAQSRPCLRLCATLGALLAVTLAFAGCAGAWSFATRPASGTPSVPPGLNGRLLFTRDTGLWTLDLASSAMHEIARAAEPGQVTAARWSPDGARVAYSVSELQQGRSVSEIYVSEPDGANVSKVWAADPNTFFQRPVWGGNTGTLYFMFSQNSPRVQRIERLELATGERQILAEQIGSFDVSPDGLWLVVIRQVEQRGPSLVAVDLATGDERELVRPGRFQQIESPRFDPRSDTIVFAASGPMADSPRSTVDFIGRSLGIFPGIALAHGAPQDLYTVSLQGGPDALLASVGADEPAVSWSPDRSHLAVLTIVSLVVYPASGGGARAILAPGSLGTLDWAR